MRNQECTVFSRMTFFSGTSNDIGIIAIVSNSRCLLRVVQSLLLSLAKSSHMSLPLFVDS